MTRLASLAAVLLAAAVCTPAAAYPSPSSSPGSEIPAPAAASAPSVGPTPPTRASAEAVPTVGAGITYHEVVRLPAAPVWFHPVPGRCPSTNTGYGGGAFWAGRPYGHHQGQDFAAATGTPIHAIGGGTIVRAGYGSGTGNQIQQRIGNLVIKYNHLAKFRRTGGWVSPNEVIGYVGATGHATGPHLHLEVWAGGQVLNPVTFLRSVGVEASC